MRTAVVIPAFREEPTIGRVVKAVIAYGVVVVVDDASPDATGTEAIAAGASVVRHDVNRGYDGALATGFAWASEHGFDAIVSIDADGQHDPVLIPRLVDPILDGDVVAVLGERPAAARVSERLFSAYTRARYGIDDILCGMKAFSSDAHRRHAAAMERRSIGTGLALACLRAGESVAVLPVPVHPRADAPRFGSTWRANARILGAMARAVACDARDSSRRDARPTRAVRLSERELQ